MVINEPNGVSFNSKVFVYPHEIPHLRQEVLSPSLQEGKHLTSKHLFKSQVSATNMERVFDTYCIIMCHQCVPKSWRDVYQSVMVRKKCSDIIFIGFTFHFCICLWAINKISLSSFTVPELYISIYEEMNYVELLFDGSNNTLPSVCIQYEQNGTCQVSVISVCI